METKQTIERDKRRARRRSRRKQARPATYSYHVPMDKHPVRFNPSGYIGPYLALRRLAMIFVIYAIAAGLVTAVMYTGKSDFDLQEILVTFIKVIPILLLLTVAWTIIGLPYLLALFLMEWIIDLRTRPSKNLKQNSPTPPAA